TGTTPDRDRAGLHEFLDAEGLQHLQHRGQLVAAAGGLDGDGLRGDVHRLGAEELDDLDDLGARLVVGAHLHQDEFALDGLAGLQLDDLQHVAQLVELLGHLLQREVLDAHHDGDAGDVGVLGDTDGERVDVAAAAGEQGGDPRQDAGGVLHQDGERALGHDLLPLLVSPGGSQSSSLSPESGRTSRAAMISSLEVPAATIGHTIASSWTTKSTTTGRSLIELASSMTLSRSAGSSQRMA